MKAMSKRNRPPRGQRRQPDGNRRRRTVTLAERDRARDQCTPERLAAMQAGRYRRLAANNYDYAERALRAADSWRAMADVELSRFFVQRALGAVLQGLEYDAAAADRAQQSAGPSA